MGWFSKLVSGGVGELVESVGGVVDNLVTSDEERAKLKNELQGMLHQHQAKMAEKAAQFEQEVTKRHASDMRSDSWLSKNIRPLGLAFLLVTTVLLAYSTIFADLTEVQVMSLKAWIPMLSSLLGTAFVFYYGSRGLEKIQKIRRGHNT